MIEITESEEYNICVQRGYQPLLDANFNIQINLRIDIQREVFGNSFISRGDVVKGNSRFYSWIWENKNHYCEECLKPLPYYSAVYISHILTRGAFPELGHDPRNINILCHRHHDQWETGKRETMRIYPNNMRIINFLKKEYTYENAKSTATRKEK